MAEIFFFSDRGSRPENQDFYCLNQTKGQLLAAVADGVGGNSGGEIASRLAIETLENGVDLGVSL